MPSQVTYSGSAGAGQALTSQVFTDVTDIDFNVANRTLNITWGVPSQVAHLSFAAATSVTYTISGTNSTVTVS